MNGPLNDCGCCQGLTAQTPADVTNRPGLSAIAYRVGTQSQFKQSMIAALSDASHPALQGLKTRDDDDFSIALLDATATMADVFTFYQERIANESYLRTATERRSMLELARLIGYELRPGVAASTLLAFTMDSSPGAPKSTPVDIGTKVQSIPGPNETAETFETVEKITARTEWSALTPQTAQVQNLTYGEAQVYLEGVATNLKPGDLLLFVDAHSATPFNSNQWDVQRITAVIPDNNAGNTLVRLANGLGTTAGSRTLPAHIKVYAFRQRAALFGANAPDWRTMPDSVKEQFAKNNLRPGLSGDYFSGTNFEDWQFNETDSKVDFKWNQKGSPASPGGGLTTEKYSVRWTGLVKAPVAGKFTFQTTSDDGVRLWVNGEKIIENWNPHSSKPKNGAIWLQAGKLYDLRLEYFQATGSASIQLAWIVPAGSSAQTIPVDCLFHVELPDEWPNFNIAYATPVPIAVPTIYLDGVYSQIVPGSGVLLSQPAEQELYQVDSVRESSKSNFTLTAKTTALDLSGPVPASHFGTLLRETVVFAQTDLLKLAKQPIQSLYGTPSQGLTIEDGVLTPVEGSRIVLDSVVADLQKGQILVVSGQLLRAKVVNADNPSLVLVSADGRQQKSLVSNEILQIRELPSVNLARDVTWHLQDAEGFAGFVTTSPDRIILTGPAKNDPFVSEAVVVEEASGEPTTVILQTPPGGGAALKNKYDRSTVKICGNVARATHGETVSEILGSGDASQTFQQFTLRQKPLTYVSAANANGAASTLQVRVNDLLWQEVPTLFGRRPLEHIFVTRTGDDGVTTVEFGDGVTGAHLPTGQNNVRALYRKGIGLGGLVQAGQLTSLLSRPLGIRSVVNPEDATGAQDPESLDEARTNASLTVLTLDRAVSLQDYEDFSRAFAGVAKALATWTWANQTRRVFITVAGPNGSPIKADSDTYKNLIAALQRAGDPFVRLGVKSYRPAHFRFAGKVKIDPVYEKDVVLAAVEQALRNTFSFDARAFGQPVMLSELIAAIQAVAGVVAVTLDRFYRTDQWIIPRLLPPPWAFLLKKAPVFYLEKSPLPNARLLAALPETLPGRAVEAAELLTLDPAPLDELGVMP